MDSLGTYVINLADNGDRLEAVGRRLHDYGIVFDRVDAVDGRGLDLSSIEDYDGKRAERYMGRSLVGGEIGCYRSHLRAAAQFLASGKPYGLVLEDDALPLCDPAALLAQVIPDLEGADPDWRLINIGPNRLKISTAVKSYTVDGRDHTLRDAHYFPMMACAIVWSRLGAQEFVDGHRTIFAPVDNYFRYWLTRTGHGYAIWPPPFTTTDAETQIASAGGGHRKRHQRTWHYGLSKQKRLIEDKIIAAYSKWRYSRRIK